MRCCGKPSCGNPSSRTKISGKIKGWRQIIWWWNITSVKRRQLHLFLLGFFFPSPRFPSLVRAGLFFPDFARSAGLCYPTNWSVYLIWHRMEDIMLASDKARKNAAKDGPSLNVLHLWQGRKNEEDKQKGTGKVQEKGLIIFFPDRC